MARPSPERISSTPLYGRCTKSQQSVFEEGTRHEKNNALVIFHVSMRFLPEFSLKNGPTSGSASMEAVAYSTRFVFLSI